MKLTDLLQTIDAEIHGPNDLEISAICTDSRSVSKGALFFALTGEVTDGHRFIEAALARGARAVVSSQPPPEGFPRTWVEVEDSRRALAAIAREFHGRPDEALQLIGITGTNGKTTTSQVASTLLQRVAGETGQIGTIGNRLGSRELDARLTTPESHENLAMMREMVDSGCKAAVMEVSSVGIHRHRVDGFDFDALVFTNFSRDHIDYHGSMDAYFEAKAALFTREHKPETVAVLNADDQGVMTLSKRIDLPMITYGGGESADLRLISASLNPDSSELVVRWRDQQRAALSQLIGRFNLWNLMAGMAAVLVLGYDFEQVCEALPAIRPVRGRVEPVPLNAPYTVLIDYAHTDDALRQLLQTLDEIAEGRLVALFGCGGDRDPGKRPMMGARVVENCDLAVLTSDNPRSERPEAIIDDVLEGINEVDSPRAEIHVEADRRRAIAWTLEQALPGDMIVLAGKGHEPYQEIAGEKLDFDERKIVSELAGQL